MKDEAGEIRNRYERRKELPTNLRYSPIDPYVCMVCQEKERAIIRWIHVAGLAPVGERRVVEIGCGGGGNLLQFIHLGFRPENLVGNELLEDRASQARHVLPVATEIFVGDASELDLEDQTFDVILQSTVFSSILDDRFQEKLAERMWKLAKPGGGVLWYDFVYNNPHNPDVRGVPVRRVRELFPDGIMRVWRLTLAPPLGRFVTKVWPRFYTWLNVFPFLRTHVLCWIEK